MPNKPTGFRIISRILFCILSLTTITSLMLQSAWALDFHVETSKGQDLSNVKTYAFTESGSYTDLNTVTDASGTAVYDSGDFTDGNYKFRTDYLGSQFWSSIITMPGTPYVETVIEEETVEVLVTMASGPAEGIKVYLFSGSGAYLGRNETTDATGKVQFDLPVGEDFKFRADMLGMQYWSPVTSIAGGGLNQVSVDAGGGLLEVTVDKGSGIHIAGVKVYLFNLSGAYLGLNQTTDSSGMVGFDVSEGDYKVRVDYLGNQFWSQGINVIQNTSITHTIPHQDVTITVGVIYQGVPNPIQGIKVYLFTASGAYQSQYQVTDTNGQVLFNLPEQAYKVRADYLGQQFWSDEFTWQDGQVDIPMAEAETTVSGAGQPLEGVNTYVFTGSGSYLSINDTTDIDGKVTFRLAAGDYKFRADYQGSQYWSGVETLLADQVNPVGISTGGDLFTLTVLKGASEPLAGVNCYVFTEAGSYLGLSATTDAGGQVSFGLADGTYKFRVDYLGYQFWTPVYQIPNQLSDDFMIDHQDVVITVEKTYQSTLAPVNGFNVYLFSSSGAYLGQYQVTGANGQVLFNLPQQVYKVRADYLGQQFWSGMFTWQDTTVTIPQGQAQIHVTRMGNDQEGARVYLFSGTGSYLGRNEDTDTGGLAWFTIPGGSYKFRADEGGDRKYSDVVNITPDQVTNVTIELQGQQPTVTLNSDPSIIPIGESSTLAWNSSNADTVTINPDIGTVGLSGTMEVGPTQTTAYTITATGPGGTTTDTVTVTVLEAIPSDVDYGLNGDEQQGGEVWWVRLSGYSTAM